MPSNIPPQPSHGPTPPMPARAGVSAEEALVRAFYKGVGAEGSSGDLQFAPPSAAYDIAETARISDPSPPQEKSELASRLKEKKKQQRSSGWVSAPATSHISRFMLVHGEQATHIQVVFKGPEGKGEVAEYMYTFPDDNSAVRIFNQLRSSAHPYGQVLYPKVIKGGIPYAPMAI